MILVISIGWPTFVIFGCTHIQGCYFYIIGYLIGYIGYLTIDLIRSGSLMSRLHSVLIKNILHYSERKLNFLFWLFIWTISVLDHTEVNYRSYARVIICLVNEPSGLGVIHDIIITSFLIICLWHLSKVKIKGQRSPKKFRQSWDLYWSVIMVMQYSTLRVCELLLFHFLLRHAIFSNVINWSGPWFLGLIVFWPREVSVFKMHFSDIELTQNNISSNYLDKECIYSL